MFPQQPSVPFVPATDDTPIGTIMPDGMTYVGTIIRDDMIHICDNMRILIIQNAVDVTQPLYEQTDALLAEYGEKLGYAVKLNAKGARLQGTGVYEKRHPGDLRLATSSEITGLFCDTQRGMFPKDPAVAERRAAVDYPDPRLVLALPGHYNKQYIVDTANGINLNKKRTEERLEQNAQDKLDIILVVEEPFYDMDTITDWYGYGGFSNRRTGNPYKPK